mmetsp:Transcript_88473/g.122218  ORF Transcript_88473/g.122218 Transcript_88473/m.122218 type:complete len:177 (-) Transcript_88473:91-621(-)
MGLVALGEAVAKGAFSQLSKLFMDNTGINDEGLINFCAVITRTDPSAAMPKLYELWLSNNNIGDAGASALFLAFKMGAMDNLGDLRLQYNHLGDESCKSLVGVLGGYPLSNVWYLGFNNNAFSNDGLRVLEEALAKGALPRLEFFTASSPQSTSEMQQQLQDTFTHRDRPPKPPRK